MNSLKFYKMQGAGNDFVVIDNRSMSLKINEIIALTPRLCDRRYGIGADGILDLEQPQIEGVDFTMVYRNADGSDAGMCGNGARCLAMFAAHHGMQSSLKFNVHDAIYTADVNKKEHLVSVYFPDVASPKRIKIGNNKLIQLYPGTEHVVCVVNKQRLEEDDYLIKTGRNLRYSEALHPTGSNVNFITLNSDSSISLQTYERGVENLTLACGTGAIASAIASHQLTNIKADTYSKTVHVKGGQLNVRFKFDQSTNTYHQVALTGPAKFVYEGFIHI